MVLEREKYFGECDMQDKRCFQRLPKDLSLGISLLKISMWRWFTREEVSLPSFSFLFLERMLIIERSPYLSLTVTEPRRSKYLSLDAWPYRMDYRDTELTKTTDQEIVMSLNRIEHIFGRLDPEGKPLKAVLTKGEEEGS
jgi:hypothetical protein